MPQPWHTSQQLSPPSLIQHSSAKTTKDTIGTETVGKQDICEFKLGMHMRISTSQYPAISW
ncbi:hypothetical protein [Archangium violaceum]|uniref:Uncharacterized protein n=1 Tax=Archangium violaceum Cb vi76 TaxID=1406225 RepID=A0A084SJQ9_9BACT|nr:hypothetical protein [Archangium violaceum]KFA88694.1 hypothetical protein Q664_39495 [Archangium violaceum Cb vi76]